MKKILALIISFLFFVNAFCQDFVASKDECVNYLMVSLAKRYLEVGENIAFSGDSEIKSARSIRKDIKIENVQDCSDLENVLTEMKQREHPGGAKKIKELKDELIEDLSLSKWKNICIDRKVKEDDPFIESTWNSILKHDAQIVPEVTSKTTEVETDGKLGDFDNRMTNIERKVNDLSNMPSYIALLLSILSLLGVAYLFYLQNLVKSKDDCSMYDSSKDSHNDNRNLWLEDRVESLRRTVEDLKKQLENQSKKNEEKQIPVQTTNSQSAKKVEEKKETEVRQSAPVQQQTVQKVYARPKSPGILREAQDSSYFTIEIKNGKSEVVFSGDSMSAIKNPNQYFDGIYDVINRNGSGCSKVVVEKNSVAVKQLDGTWMITEKGILRFK